MILPFSKGYTTTKKINLGSLIPELSAQFYTISVDLDYRCYFCKKKIDDRFKCRKENRVV